MPTSVLLVRHAMPVVSAGLAPGEWALSPSGRVDSAALGTRLASLLDASPVGITASSERKAIETAELLNLGPVRIDARLCEVAKPWYDDGATHEVAAHQYLAGSVPKGWEPRNAAIARFSAAICDAEGDLVVVVSHGTVMSLWLAEHLPELDPQKYWSDLRMPDAWLLELGLASLKRLGSHT